MSGLGVRDAVVRYIASAADVVERAPNRRRVVTWVPPSRAARGATREITAVDGVSLDVAPGEVVALLGPSGSGKSSLLRAIAGLEPLASGTVTWDGVDLAGVPTHKRGFGLMFQEPALFPSLTVARNVAYGLHELPRAQRPAVVTRMLELVELPGYGPRRITELSGGQAQRVALARSLAPEPRLLLLDEPLSALDRSLREHLAEVLARVLRATGTTAVHVTHDQDEAFTIADRVAVLVEGRLLQIDTPSVLWRRPATREVAAFLGYGPFLAPADAAGLGLPGVAPGDVVGLGPRSLVPDAAGTVVDVRSEHMRRGYVEVAVALPSGESAELRVPDRIGAGRMGVRLDPQAVAVVPGVGR